MIFILIIVLQMHPSLDIIVIELFVVEFRKITQKLSANLQFIIYRTQKH